MKNVWYIAGLRRAHQTRKSLTAAHTGILYNSLQL
ncbi:hypothetical protein [Escherichia phage Ecp_YSF]|nr:hypothetical protein [Escherichia phage Ecp_YSF]